MRALSQADRVLLCEISAIRECAIDGVSSELIVSLIGEKAAMASEENVIEQLRGQHSGAIIIMGAANLDAVKENILGK